MIALKGCKWQECTYLFGSDRPLEERVEDLVSKLTLRESFADDIHLVSYSAIRYT